ncbi:MAG TPA: M15 family metallopeptidase [Flavisolibacter sp.]|nr:M15 family metallopeptidase [Flavisolibacter sp.]
MTELKAAVPGIVYDLRYAGTANFTGKKLYPRGDLGFMRLAPALALKQVQEALNKKGYGLKVFDAYRPHGATVKMWELVKDERYAANPAKGSGHNRGLAIDLTIIEMSSGKELDMGTGFDSFTDTAHHAFQQLPKKVLENRLLLKQAMEAAGFKPLSTEWWHYSWPNDRNYAVLDIPFRSLLRAPARSAVR